MNNLIAKNKGIFSARLPKTILILGENGYNTIELNTEIAKIVARQNERRTAIDEIVADIEGKNSL